MTVANLAPNLFGAYVKSDLQLRLKDFALKRTIPFCYSCYQNAPSGKCNLCNSDDLMTFLPGHGCDYGFEWAIAAILRKALIPINIEEMFSESVRSCFPEDVNVGWMSLDVVSAIKKIDPISWSVAMDEWLEEEVRQENIVFAEEKYFSRTDVEDLLGPRVQSAIANA